MVGNAINVTFRNIYNQYTNFYFIDKIVNGHNFSFVAYMDPPVQLKTTWTRVIKGNFKKLQNNQNT